VEIVFLGIEKDKGLFYEGGDMSWGMGAVLYGRSEYREEFFDSNPPTLV
jgi:hypothetical protein